MNIYEKIYQVMQDINYLQKDGFVETGRDKNGKQTGYKALTDEKVVSSIRPALIKARLIILPVEIETKRTDEEITDRSGYVKKNRVTDCRLRYRIIDIDNPADFIDVVSSGTGVDTQDKGIGKAMTYARKYMLLNSFLIPTGNDTDDISSDMYDAQLYGKPDPHTERPSVSADVLRAEIIALSSVKGVPAETITGATYDGKAWADLDSDTLLLIKRNLLRKDA